DCICITDHVADPRRSIGKLSELASFSLGQNQVGEYFTPIGLKNLSFIANSDFHKPKHIYSWKTLLHCPNEPEAITDCISGDHDVAITLYRDLDVAPAVRRGFVAA